VVRRVALAEYEWFNHAGVMRLCVRQVTPEAEQGDAEAQYYLALSLRGSLPTPNGASLIEPSESDPRNGWPTTA
jgi:hypothetical protein